MIDFSEGARPFSFKGLISVDDAWLRHHPHVQSDEWGAVSEFAVGPQPGPFLISLRALQVKTGSQQLV